MNSTARSLALVTVAATLAAAGALLAPTPAVACGGFFCNPGPAIIPPVQTAERVLFQVHDDDTVTTTVEIQFEGDPIDFAWVLPVPRGMDPDAVATAPAGLFDELESLTAPRFLAPSYGDAEATADVAGMSAGCGGCAPFPFWGGGRFSDDMDVDSFDPFAGIDIVGSAVAGPYSIEVIEASVDSDLTTWLGLNGYQIPQVAREVIEGYQAADMAFLGVKLLPEDDSGPLEALSFTIPGEAPMLPLRLTQIAAVQNMEIVAYVVANERWTPANYTDIPFDYSDVSWLSEEETSYEGLLSLTVDQAGGRAFNTEYAAELTRLHKGTSVAAGLLPADGWISRFRTFIDPASMTIDPVWQPAPELGEVANVHLVEGEPVDDVTGPVVAFLLAAMFGGLGLRCRSRTGIRT